MLQADLDLYAQIRHLGLDTKPEKLDDDQQKRKTCTAELELDRLHYSTSRYSSHGIRGCWKDQGKKEEKLDCDRTKNPSPRQEGVIWHCCLLVTLFGFLLVSYVYYRLCNNDTMLLFGASLGRLFKGAFISTFVSITSACAAMSYPLSNT